MALIAATGLFDGVHLGHRKVLETLVGEAVKASAESLVITFWPHPRAVLQNGAREFRLLTGLSEKTGMIKALGVDRVEVLPFTREFGRLTADEYLRLWVRDRLGCTAVVVGYDNTFGCDTPGPDEVSRLAEKAGLGVIRCQGLSPDGEQISSTRIRKAISEGDVSLAGAMLGYRYSLTGVVVSGNAMGRKLGFPTANIKPYEPLKLVPANGVYAVEVEVLGRKYLGMCNIGFRPTVSAGGGRTIETHILGFDEDIYGLDLKVSFVERIRGEVKFPSVEALKGQLRLDRAAVLALFGGGAG